MTVSTYCYVSLLEEVRWSRWPHKLSPRPVAVFPGNLSGLFNKPIPLDEIRNIEKGAIIFIYYFHLLLTFQSRRAVSLKFSLKIPHRRCQDSWAFIFQPPKQRLSEWLLKFLRSFPGVWGVSGREPRNDRRLKGSHTRKICPEARGVHFGFKCVLARTELPCLSAKVSSEQASLLSIYISQSVNVASLAFGSQSLGFS